MLIISALIRVLSTPALCNLTAALVTNPRRDNLHHIARIE